MSSERYMSTAKCRTFSDPNRRYFRIAEAAAYLNSTPWFIRTLIWKRAIPFITIGKRHVIDRQDLDLYVENAKTGTA